MTMGSLNGLYPVDTFIAMLKPSVSQGSRSLVHICSVAGAGIDKQLSVLTLGLWCPCNEVTCHSALNLEGNRNGKKMCSRKNYFGPGWLYGIHILFIWNCSLFPKAWGSTKMATDIRTFLSSIICSLHSVEYTVSGCWCFSTCISWFYS